MSWFLLLLATVGAAIWQALGAGLWVLRPDLLLLVTMAVAWRKGLLAGCVIGAFCGMLLGAARLGLVLPMVLLYVAVAAVTAVRAYRGAVFELPLLALLATVWLACSDFVMAFGHGLSLQVGGLEVLQLALLHALLLIPLSFKPCALTVGDY